MTYELLPGDKCLIYRDCLVEGELAFEKGELITITAIDPDPQCPGLKYVVHSERLGRQVRLPGSNI